MGLTVSELESRFTADLSDLEKGAVRAETISKQIDGRKTTVKVDAETQGAVKDINTVTEASKKLVATKAVATVDANVKAADLKILELKQELTWLSTKPQTAEVKADTAKAEKALEEVQKELEGLQQSRTELAVGADTREIDQALDVLPEKAAVSGHKAGRESGKGISKGLIVGLATIPALIAAVGAAAAGAFIKAFTDGLDNEVRADTLMAKTGLDEVTVGKLARAAGEAYANNWGESIDANMDTARIAVQSSLLDPEATQRDAQAVIESLSGVASVLGEDVSRVARSATQLIKNGLVDSADEAFDVLIKGQQAGLNVSEDWLDTLDEYSTKWRDLGLSAPQAMGLLSQAVKGGARDTDVAADALKEFAIRAIDGSKTTAQGYKILGLDAKDMQEKISKGGKSAGDGLDQVLDRLRTVEDPALRAQAAVDLFGTKAEDMGKALYNMDLSTAVKQLGDVEGAASKALGVLSDNDQNNIDTARRNIELAVDGIKGALAGAFSEPLEDAATFVTEHRTEVIQFLIDMVNGAIGFARAYVEGMASAVEATGTLVSEAGPLVLDLIGKVVDGWATLAEVADPFNALGLRDSARHAQEQFKGFQDDANKAFAAVKTGSEDTADFLRTDVVGALDQVQGKFNQMTTPMLADAKTHDAAIRLAKAMDGLGTSADGVQLHMKTATGYAAAMGDVFDTSTSSGRELDKQVRDIAQGMIDQADAASDAGTSNEELTKILDEQRDSLVKQLEALGLTEDQANQVADAYGAIPTDIVTTVTADTSQATEAINTLKGLLTAEQWDVYNQARSTYSSAGIPTGSSHPRGHTVKNATGNILSMAPLATMVPPGTMRVVGDRMDVDEAYIPMDGSPRSIALLLEAARRMPGFRGFADGGMASDPLVVKVPIEQRNSTPVNINISRFDGNLEQLIREAKMHALEGVS